MWQLKPCPPIPACFFMNVWDAGKFCARLPAIVAFFAHTAQYPVRQSRRPGRAAAPPVAVDELPREAWAPGLPNHLDRQLSLDLTALRGQSPAPGLYGFCDSAAPMPIR